MEFANPYWSDKTRIELLSKWIIIHSIIYYELNTNIVSDHMFDANSRQLVCLVAANRQAFKESKWYYVLKNFDGSTGFDLFRKLTKEHKNELRNTAQYLVNRFGKEGANE